MRERLAHSFAREGAASLAASAQQQPIVLHNATLVDGTGSPARQHIDITLHKGHPEALSHCSGQVFDIDYSALPPAELECLRFVLSDLGWNGYLGFVDEGPENLHIGCSPGARDFFSSVYQEVQERASNVAEPEKSAHAR